MSKPMGRPVGLQKESLPPGGLPGGGPGPGQGEDVAVNVAAEMGYDLTALLRGDEQGGKGGGGSEYAGGKGGGCIGDGGCGGGAIVAVGGCGGGFDGGCGGGGGFGGGCGGSFDGGPGGCGGPGGMPMGMFPPPPGMNGMGAGPGAGPGMDSMAAMMMGDGSGWGGAMMMGDGSGGRREGRGSRGGRKNKGAGGNVEWGPEIEGFEDALMEAFTVAGVGMSEPNIKEVVIKILNVAHKQVQTYQADPRSGQRMSAAMCKAFLGEFIEQVMTNLSNFLYEKSWFERVSWNGPLLMLTQHAFQSGKIFTRVMATDVLQVVDEGLLAWSEEERMLKVYWMALEAAGVQEGKHSKNANKHLRDAYDDAFFNSPFGSNMQHGGTPELMAIMDFIKGFMTSFLQRAQHVLTMGLRDTSTGGQTTAISIIFGTLMDSASPCLPLHLHPSLPPAPWWYINQCTSDVMAEWAAKEQGAAKRARYG